MLKAYIDSYKADSLRLMTNILKKKLKQNLVTKKRKAVPSGLKTLLQRHKRAASRQRLEILKSVQPLNGKIQSLFRKVRVLLHYLKKKVRAGMLEESSKTYKSIIDYIAGLLKKALLNIIIVMQLSLLIAPISFASTVGDDTTKIALAVTATGLTLTIGVVAGISYLMGGCSVPRLIKLLEESGKKVTTHGKTKLEEWSSGAVDQLHGLKDSSMMGLRGLKNQTMGDLQDIRQQALEHTREVVSAQSDEIFGALDVRLTNLSDTINPVRKAKVAGEKTAAFIQNLCKKALSAQPGEGASLGEEENYRPVMADALQKHLQNLAQQQDSEGIEGILETIPEAERDLLAQYVCLSQPNSTEGTSSEGREARLLAQFANRGTPQTSASGAHESAYHTANGGAGSGGPSDAGAANSIAEPLTLMNSVETTVDLLFTLGVTGLYCMLIYRIFRFEIFWLRYLVWEPYVAAYFQNGCFIIRLTKDWSLPILKLLGPRKRVLL